MNPALPRLLALALITLVPSAADAFCGVYVGGAGSKLYNKASQVIVARVNDRTTLSMRNDYRGKLDQFALVVPVPVALTRSQVTTLEPDLFDRIDAYTAPRLVEYVEHDPCASDSDPDVSTSVRSAPRSRPSSVRVVEEFELAEYDIVVLAADEAGDLERWLRDNGYAVPRKAARALAPYIKRQMHFFAAKVDASRITAGADGRKVLSPLQFHFSSPTFELPIRLGMMNAHRGPQDLIIYALTTDSRVAVKNYPTVPMPEEVELGARVPRKKKQESSVDAFGRYYLSKFNTLQDRAGGAAVMMEYAWDTGQRCDPCPVSPLKLEELQALGLPSHGIVTRLHTRYGPKLFRDDFELELTEHPKNFQSRFILRKPWKGRVTCKDPIRGDWSSSASGLAGSLSTPTRTVTTRRGGDGFLTVIAVPWALVSIDGVPKGATPLVKVRLSEGKHVLRFVNKEQRIQETRLVRITGGRTTTMRVKLKASPEADPTTKPAAP